jgi:hypothetical protein
MLGLLELCSRLTQQFLLHPLQFLLAHSRLAQFVLLLLADLPVSTRRQRTGLVDLLLLLMFECDLLDFFDIILKAKVDKRLYDMICGYRFFGLFLTNLVCFGRNKMDELDTAVY